MNDFVIWGAGYYKGFCVVGNPRGFTKQFLLMDGISLLDQWPENVVCQMSAKFPKDIKLADNLFGCDYPTVSGRLKERIAAVSDAAQIEFLPVTILNHKERIASSDYYLLNPVGSLDCIDIEKSGVEWNAIDSEVISGFTQLVLKEDAIPPGVALFRPKYRTMTILALRSLTNQLSADGFTGFFFSEPSDYRG